MALLDAAHPGVVVVDLQHNQAQNRRIKMTTNPAANVIRLEAKKEYQCLFFIQSSSASAASVVAKRASVVISVILSTVLLSWKYSTLGLWCCKNKQLIYRRIVHPTIRLLISLPNSRVLLVASGCRMSVEAGQPEYVIVNMIAHRNLLNLWGELSRPSPVIITNCRERVEYRQ